MTSQEYNRTLDVIRQLYPDSEWIPLLDRGYTAANVLYIEEAMKELKINVKNIVEDGVQELAESGDHDLTDAYLSGLYQKLNKLQSNRSKLSNKFHICLTDKQRQTVSKDIGKLQAVIGSIMKSIDYYKATGIKVEEIEDDFDMPADKFALSRKLNVIRASISRLKKRIKEMEEMDKPNARQIAIEKNNLKKYLIEKLYAEQKLENI